MLQAKGGYTYVFTEADKKEIIAAVDKIKARGVSTEQEVRQVSSLHACPVQLTERIVRAALRRSVLQSALHAMLHTGHEDTQIDS